VIEADRTRAALGMVRPRGDGRGASVPEESWVWLAELGAERARGELRAVNVEVVSPWVLGNCLDQIPISLDAAGATGRGRRRCRDDHRPRRAGWRKMNVSAGQRGQAGGLEAVADLALTPVEPQGCRARTVRITWSGCFGGAGKRELDNRGRRRRRSKERREHQRHHNREGQEDRSYAHGQPPLSGRRARDWGQEAAGGRRTSGYGRRGAVDFEGPFPGEELQIGGTR